MVSLLDEHFHFDNDTDKTLFSSYDTSASEEEEESEEEVSETEENKSKQFVKTTSSGRYEQPYIWSTRRGGLCEATWINVIPKRP